MRQTIASRCIPAERLSRHLIVTKLKFNSQHYTKFKSALQHLYNNIP